MTIIKPIETIYNGYRFRSRLEARWAVFFDALELLYSYEPEGFDLNGLWYLPDFFVSNELWVEIKPNLQGNGDTAKAEQFVLTTGFPLAMCWGEPWYTDWQEGRGILLYERCQNPETPPCIIRNPVTWTGLAGITSRKLHVAYLAARQARFEHGEIGKEG